MKIKSVEKFLGQSWHRWFTESLKVTGFSRDKSGNYKHENGAVIRLYRKDGKYGIKTAGSGEFETYQFTFAYNTGVLCA